LRFSDNELAKQHELALSRGKKLLSRTETEAPKKPKSWLNRLTETPPD
jgi:hypothetical protein